MGVLAQFRNIDEVSQCTWEQVGALLTRIQWIFLGKGSLVWLHSVNRGNAFHLCRWCKMVCFYGSLLSSSSWLFSSWKFSTSSWLVHSLGNPGTVQMTSEGNSSFWLDYSRSLTCIPALSLGDTWNSLSDVERHWVSRQWCTCFFWAAFLSAWEASFSDQPLLCMKMSLWWVLSPLQVPDISPHYKRFYHCYHVVM